MSRSYRNRHRDIICRDYMKSSGHCKKYKRYANKKCRKSVLANGSYYKKCYCSWDIHDYSYFINDLPKDWKANKYFRYFMCK